MKSYIDISNDSETVVEKFIFFHDDNEGSPAEAPVFDCSTAEIDTCDEW